ncbi:hypothetical protein [Pedobacter rhizosphaerae]|uniref:Uncharacterized protein n=1 Tax=Pedobacter rhizosphaerae TaxID=390241 RepID=A0A1H9PSL4_9SPHI|nr:hypothetical protein [Pedobacter rhizosphaerae]SER50563.1 hypothetical protein SAMN04488023_11070 [Pedobacter rhizosphaerae]
MTVTVLAILETEFTQEPALAKIMNNRLQRAANELRDIHLFPLSGRRFATEDLVVYISYNANYKIRYRIVSNVTTDIQYFVAERCGRLGYVLWKHVVTAREVRYS